MEVYIDNDNVLTVDQLKDIITGQYINNATITATIKDIRGREVDGISWPLSVPPVSANTTGKYQAVIDDDLKVAENPYYLYLSIDAGSDRIANWRLETRALRRTS